MMRSDGERCVQAEIKIDNKYRRCDDIAIDHKFRDNFSNNYENQTIKQKISRSNINKDKNAHNFNNIILIPIITSLQNTPEH